MNLLAELAGRLTLPVIASPMLIASGPELAIAQCQAGIVGSFPALNARPAQLLDDWLHQVKCENETFQVSNPNAVVGPLAINQIVHRSNRRLERDMEVVISHQVPIVITSLGARTDVNEAVHSYGGVVLHDVTSNEFAKKAVQKGADGLIAVAAGAGGHAGTISPFALVREIREWFDGPVVLSGSIAHGQSLFAALAAGADMGYIGSAFLSTPEANVGEGYREMLLSSSAKDIVYTNLFTGVHGNYLRGSIAAAGLNPDALPTSDPSVMNMGGERESKPWRDIWGSGQGIGVIHHSVPVLDLVGRLKREYEEAAHRMRALTQPSQSGAAL